MYASRYCRRPSGVSAASSAMRRPNRFAKSSLSVRMVWRMIWSRSRPPPLGPSASPPTPVLPRRRSSSSRRAGARSCGRVQPRPSVQVPGSTERTRSPRSRPSRRRRRRRRPPTRRRRRIPRRARQQPPRVDSEGDTTRATRAPPPVTWRLDSSPANRQRTQPTSCLRTTLHDDSHRHHHETTPCSRASADGGSAPVTVSTNGRSPEEDQPGCDPCIESTLHG
jgi:hypothetical protein